MVFTRRHPMSKTDTKELWNSLCSINGFVSWDKLNGWTWQNDLLIWLQLCNKIHIHT